MNGVVFSLTLVALSLASSQFGSRLLRNFMRDCTNQLVLGTFIATAWSGKSFTEMVQDANAAGGGCVDRSARPASNPSTQ